MSSTWTRKLLAVTLIGGYAVFRGAAEAAANSHEQFNRENVQLGIAKVLRDSYGIDEVTNVSCPENMLVIPHVTYTCTLDVKGAPHLVTITVTKWNGTYEVSRPH